MKKYTRKQIQEAIAYWKKQLAKGNYKKVNESIEHEGASDDIGSELAARDDIPNYVKAYIRDEVLADAGHDGIGWHDWNLDEFVEDLLEERVITVTTFTGKNGPGINIPTHAVPLKVTPQQIIDYVHRVKPNAELLTVEIEFGGGAVTYVAGFAGEYDDDEWVETIAEGDQIPIDLGEDGDATRVYNQYKHRSLVIGPDGTAN